MNPEIVEMLRRVGVPAHVKGYVYLKDALDICYSDRSFLEAVTKRLYPAVAKREDTMPSRVERAIRHAVGISWGNGDPEIHKSLFGPVLHQPTNSEFIATLTEQLHLEYDAVPTAEGR